MGKSKPIGHAVLLLAITTLLSACGNNDGESEQEIVRTVRIETVKITEALAQRRFVGRVDALKTVDLSFQVGGRLAELPVQQGTVVAKGGLIAALDPTDFRLNEQEAKTQYAFAQLDLGRKRNLAASDTIPKVMLDEAETAFKLRQVALDNARRNLSYARIAAPFDALVTRRLLDIHSHVAPHQAVVRVQDVSALHVKINVPEDLIRLIGLADAMNIEAEFPGQPGKRLPLRYLEHATEADAVAQTYEVTLELQRTNDLTILPGMTVSVSVDSPFVNGSTEITIPLSAIDTDEHGKTRVWLFNPQTETVSPHVIEIGAVAANRIPILSGLSGGEHIVTAGGHLLHDGMKVRRFTGF